MKLDRDVLVPEFQECWAAPSHLVVRRILGNHELIRARQVDTTFWKNERSPSPPWDCSEVEDQIRGF